jgi:hypothetical protein
MKRRKFLKNTGHFALSTSYYYGLQALWDTCLQTNSAYASTASDINYVNIQANGAPPRWMFDQPLNPFNNSGQFTAGGFGTSIEKSGSTFKSVHKGVKMDFGGQSLWLPPVWGLKSEKLNQPLNDLLKHSLMVRGIDMEINSHNVNQQRIVRPVSSQPSLHGLVADRSTKPLAASGGEGMIGTTAFKSQSGMSILQAPLNNPIPTLVDAFSGPMTKASELDFDILDTIEAFDTFAKERGISSVGAEGQQNAAFKMFEKNFENFHKNWGELFEKYQGIISAEIRAPFSGVTTSNPIGTKTSPFRYNRGSNDFISGKLQDQITNDTNINQMAQGFAFAEFVLMNDLSSSVSVRSSTVTMGRLKIGNLTNDQHFVGSVTSTYFTSLMYRALASCLLEFTNKLKAKGIFDNTVIHYMSEFSRTPQKDGGGSDHGFNGASSLILSGMIQEPALVGNINKTPKASMRTSYPGTWGEAAPYFKGTRPIANDDVIQTLCEMLEVPKIAVKGKSLVKKSSGKVTLTSDREVKNVG